MGSQVRPQVPREEILVQEIVDGRAADTTELPTDTGHSTDSVRHECDQGIHQTEHNNAPAEDDKGGQIDGNTRQQSGDNERINKCLRHLSEYCIFLYGEYQRLNKQSLFMHTAINEHSRDLFEIIHQRKEEREKQRQQEEAERQEQRQGGRTNDSGPTSSGHANVNDTTDDSCPPGSFKIPPRSNSLPEAAQLQRKRENKSKWIYNAKPTFDKFPNPSIRNSERKQGCDKPVGSSSTVNKNRFTFKLREQLPETKTLPVDKPELPSSKSESACDNNGQSTNIRRTKRDFIYRCKS